MSLLPSTQILVDVLVQEVRWYHEACSSLPFRERCEALRKLQAAITLALKEQDRNTRHACAEAMNLDLIGKDFSLTPDEVLTRAHSACMNVKAI